MVKQLLSGCAAFNSCFVLVQYSLAEVIGDNQNMRRYKRQHYEYETASPVALGLFVPF
jgi:hypothetical protein